MVGKVSPAFEPYLEKSGPNDPREAIVVYRAPSVKIKTVRGRLRELQRRLDTVENWRRSRARRARS